jgi:hypothetical protein
VQAVLFDAIGGIGPPAIGALAAQTPYTVTSKRARRSGVHDR